MKVLSDHSNPFLLSQGDWRIQIEQSDGAPRQTQARAKVTGA